MLTELANQLSDVVDTPDGVRDVMGEAGAAVRRIALQGSPYEMWRNALESAEREGTLPNVLSVIRDRYPDNLKLADAEVRYWMGRPRNPDDGNVDAQFAVLQARLVYLERSIRSNAERITRLETRLVGEWGRLVLLAGVAAALSSFFTIILSRLT